MSTVQATNLKHGSSATNNIVLDASGNTTISGAATISGNAVVTGTLQANGVTGSVYPLVLGTAVASTSGTAIDFTGIPSWVRRITVYFNGVSTNGTSNPIIQLGDSGGIETTGYISVGAYFGGATVGANYTTGFGYLSGGAANVLSGHTVISAFGSNTFTASGNLAGSGAAAGFIYSTSGIKTLSDTLDRVRITTVGGTDTFDAGSINIMFE